MKNDEAINVFEAYLATGHVPYPYELREASRMAISALKGEMPLPEDTVLFNKGVEEGKEQMMKEAVEGNVVNTNYPTQIQLKTFDSSLKDGQKVKLIIVKED